ncbi:MAG: hypothetical protein JXC31_05680 [Acholeplasmataceae bacterium]|nr:hypothetical protein [Acholeplasmataceae bacterium]
MKRKLKIKLTSLITVIVLMMSIPTVAYAWMTYVEEKSLVTITTGEISVSTYANELVVINDIDLEDLAYIDYQKDFINNESSSLDVMASSLRIDLVASEQTVSIKHQIQLIDTSAQEGLIYIIIYEGIDIDEQIGISTDYHSRVLTIINGLSTKEEQLAALTTYNQSVLDNMYEQVMSAGQKLTFQIVFWGDYDAAPDPSLYLDQVYSFTMILDIVNSKGEVA